MRKGIQDVPSSSHVSNFEFLFKFLLVPGITISNMHFLIAAHKTHSWVSVSKTCLDKLLANDEEGGQIS